MGLESETQDGGLKPPLKRVELLSELADSA
jgi:hypothetical protein